MPDTKPDEYLRQAKACMEVAERMSLREDRKRMLEMAERWLQLARDALTKFD